MIEEVPNLAEHRKRLKQKLWRNRALRASGLPICPICGNEIKTWQGGQMHEVFLTRGDAQKLPEMARLNIYNPDNCVIVCDETCHTEAATKRGKVLCAKQILLFEGYMQVTDWLRQAAREWKGEQPMIEDRFVFEVMLSLSMSPIYDPDPNASAPVIHGNQPRWKANDFK